jgi:hypothetical protein
MKEKIVRWTNISLTLPAIPNRVTQTVLSFKISLLNWIKSDDYNWCSTALVNPSQCITNPVNCKSSELQKQCNVYQWWSFWDAKHKCSHNKRIGMASNLKNFPLYITARCLKLVNTFVCTISVYVWSMSMSMSILFVLYFSPFSFYLLLSLICVCMCFVFICIKLIYSLVFVHFCLS